MVFQVKCDLDYMKHSTPVDLEPCGRGWEAGYPQEQIFLIFWFCVSVCFKGVNEVKLKKRCFGNNY